MVVSGFVVPVRTAVNPHRGRKHYLGPVDLDHVRGQNGRESSSGTETFCSKRGWPAQSQSERP